MRLTLTLIASFALLALSASTALAQDGDDETAAVTARLTLYGEVPEGTYFTATIVPVPKPEGQSEIGIPIQLCGGTDEFGNPIAPCERGRSYTVTRELPVGSTYRYTFSRLSQGGLEGESFFRTTVTVEDGATVESYYDFGGGDEQEVPEEMPDTGAGALGGAVPLGPLAAALPLLGAEAYTARRRR